MNENLKPMLPDDEVRAIGLRAVQWLQRTSIIAVMGGGVGLYEGIEELISDHVAVCGELTRLRGLDKR